MADTRLPVLVFARAPRLGRAKTRLAAGLGALAAQRVYRLCLKTVLARLARDPRLAVVLCVTPDGALREMRALAPPGVRLLPQGRGDLGARMARAFANLPPGPAVLVGGDVPDVSPRHIVTSLKASGRADVVLGPSEDGGYWLVGAKRLRSLSGRVAGGLFSRVRWSGPHALADTLASLPKTARVHLLEECLVDLDTAEDFWRWRATGGRFAMTRRITYDL